MSVPSYIKLTPNMNTNTLVNALNQNFNQIQSQDRTKITTDENGINRILLGREPGGDYVLAITVPGKDVIEELQR